MSNNIVYSLFRLAFYAPLAVFLILLSPCQGNLADENSGLTDY